jgi:hypothetical protein
MKFVRVFLLSSASANARTGEKSLGLSERFADPCGGYREPDRDVPAPDRGEPARRSFADASQYMAFMLSGSSIVA